jgi:ATP-dependent DNA helicase RecQ
VITGAVAEQLHPQRKRLVGRDAGEIFDRLAQVHLNLQRGEGGIEKPLSCTQTTLRHIAEKRPANLLELDRIPGMGGIKTDRFGAAFLAVIAGE